MIEAGEYIRTTEGCIVKINNDEHLDFLKFSNAVIGDIVKHSKNIIDLIEVGDYVNGEKITNITKNYITVGGNTFGIKNLKGIKTILTHEIYEQNCYKVGED